MSNGGNSLAEELGGTNAKDHKLLSQENFSKNTPNTNDITGKDGCDPTATDQSPIDQSNTENQQFTVNSQSN